MLLDSGLPCPPWDDYAAFDDRHSIINLQADKFFDGLEEDDDDEGGAGSTYIDRKYSSSVVVKHGRGKELRRAIRVLKPTAKQLAAAYRLLHNKSKTSSIHVDGRDHKPHSHDVAAKGILKTTSTNSIHKDRPTPTMMMMKMKMKMKMAMQNKKINSITANDVVAAGNPKTMVTEQRNKDVVTTAAARINHVNNNNNKIGPKGDQKVKVVPCPRDEESSMQLKFQSAKRKLHDSYERINAAKKQRSIQVIDFQKPPLPLPKPKPRRTSNYHAKYPAGNKFHQPAAILQY